MPFSSLPICHSTSLLFYFSVSPILSPPSTKPTVTESSNISKENIAISRIKGS